jgi:broad-specificity NMP kinase
MDKVVSIFSHGKPMESLQAKDRPVLVVLVGSPGVGKTSVGSTFLKQHPFTSHLTKDDFYNVSSDLLLERVQPYRNATDRLYDLVKESKGELTNANFSVLANASLTTIISKKSNFLLPQTEARLRQRLLHPNADKDAPKVCECGCGKTLKPATIKLHMKKIEGEEEKTMSIVDLTKYGLEIGIQHGLNIIYDTTLKERDIIKEDIIPLIRAHKQVYNIVVLLVTASPEDIKERLRGRHHAMISEGYLRAIKYELVEKFVELNERAFHAAKEYYKKHKRDYQDITFDFVEKHNPQRSPRKSRSRVRSPNHRSRSHRSTHRSHKRSHRSTQRSANMQSVSQFAMKPSMNTSRP